MSHASLKAIKDDLRIKHKSLMRSAPPDLIDTHSRLTTKTIIGHTLYQSARTLCLFLSLPHEFQTKHLLQHALEHNKKVFVPTVTGPNTMEMRRIYSYDDYTSLPLSSWNIPEPHPYVSSAVVDPKDRVHLQPFNSADPVTSLAESASHLIAPAEGVNNDNNKKAKDTNGDDGDVDDDADAADTNKPDDDEDKAGKDNNGDDNDSATTKDGDEERITLLQRENVRQLSHILDLSLVVCPCVAFDKDKNRLGYGRGFYDRYLASIFEARAQHGKGPVPLLLAALPSQFESTTIPTNDHDMTMTVAIAGDLIIE